MSKTGASIREPELVRSPTSIECDAMRIPLVLPELGAGNGELRVSCWLVDLGDAVGVGDRIVEILFDGITFDVTAEKSGKVTRIDKSLESIVRAGDVLGWIETDEDPA